MRSTKGVLAMAALAAATFGTHAQEAGEPVAGGVLAPMAHDLSVTGMFLAADIVVQAVMLGLVLASIATWTVGFFKLIEIRRANGQVRAALSVVGTAGSLHEAEAALARSGGPGAAMVKAASEEARQSAAALPRSGGDGLKERVASRLSRIEARAGRGLSRGTGLLASVASVAPFVGLFGTVWGIMNSFIGIAESGTTNLAIVAPGIAEALLATGIGLVAAIPAVLFYNGFARAITGYRAALADAGAAVERLVSRDLDFARFSAGPQGAR